MTTSFAECSLPALGGATRPQHGRWEAATQEVRKRAKAGGGFSFSFSFG
jgi:hypothetical protein